MQGLVAISVVTSSMALTLGLGVPAASADGAVRPAPVGTVQQAVTTLTTQGSKPAAAKAAAGSAMTGRFVISTGSCTSGAVPKGSYFSMRDPGGGAVNNGNSPCSNQGATPLKAGADGLTPGRMQPFNSSPGSSDLIVAPTNFFGSPFAVATQSPDKQSGKDASAPEIFNDGGRLSGQVSSFQAFYNGAYYNQGAPKPDGSTPGSTTSGVTGTYAQSSGAFTLDWKSTISGGAFNNFTGVWHLEGVYRGGGGAPTSSSSAGGAAAPSGNNPPTTGAGTQPAGSQPTRPSLANTGATTAPAALALLLLAGLAAMVRRRTLPEWSR